MKAAGLIFGAVTSRYESHFIDDMELLILNELIE